MNVLRSRPGVRFAADTGASPEPLTRMDVALFVGFASRGPIDRPVAIDDVAQFDAVFGPAPRLAWDIGRQGWNQGHLAAAVRAFFANGGRRCWVSRVAGAAAQAGQFDLSGCVRVAGAGGALHLKPAILQASSEGSWSDTLKLSARVQARPITVQFVAGDAALAWRVKPATKVPVQPGDLLRLAPYGAPEAGWFPVQKVAIGSDGLQRLGLGAGVVVRRLPDEPVQAPQAAPTVHAASAGAWRFVQGQVVWHIEAAAAPVAGTQWADVVTLELQVGQGEGEPQSLPALGLVAGHPAFVGALSTDAQRETSMQALPLAGTESDMPDAGADLFYLPLGLTGFFEDLASVRPSPLPPLTRDGLAHFDAALFLDPELAEIGSAELMARADDLRYRADRPRRLRGLHVALGWHDSSVGDEATLIAVPDAAHSPWQAATPQAPSWRWVHAPLPAAAEASTFGDCGSTLPAPVLDGLVDSAAATATLMWSLPAGVTTPGQPYEVQASRTPDFGTVLWTTEPLEVLVFAMGAADAAGCSFRVRACGATGPGAWSQVLTLQLEPQAATPDAGPANLDVALQIHQALLNLCAARMDLFAVLALPNGCQEDQAVAHARALSTLLIDDGRLASFGAIYHPWIQTAAPGAPPLPRPPDGAACGLLAACARDRGAWIAPANRLVQGALALHPRPVAQTAAFVETGINLLEPSRGGVSLLSAETLSDNAALRPLQVRRLLMLLRRLAGQIGNELVFEPQGAALHAAVERRFEQWLGGLFQRGAFAGERESDAFRVVVDSARDGGRSAERGQLVVELRVRPAQALQFLQLRLLLGGAGRGDWLEAA